MSQVRLAEFVLTIVLDQAEVISEEEAALEDLNSMQRELHAAVLRRLDLRRAGGERIEANKESLERSTSSPTS